MDLIREILLFAEEHCDGKQEISVDISKLAPPHNTCPMDTISEHILLLADREFIVGSFYGKEIRLTRLTWEGHEFLDNARTPEVWNAAKASAGHLSFTVLTNVLTTLATKHGLTLLKTGFDVAVC